MASYSEFYSNVSGDNASKLRDLVEDSNTVLLRTMNGKIIIMHRPTTFGGTRSMKTNTIVCLMRLGTIATGVLLDKESVVESKKFKAAEGTTVLKCDTENKLPS